MADLLQYRYRMIVLNIIIALGLFGCQGAAYKAMHTMPEYKPDTEVRLVPGDVLEIRFPYASQFNNIDETQTIMPNGKITLALVGEVTAAGKTPSELQAELVKLHASQLKNPVITVSVKSLFDRKVYVGGEVNKPGLVSLPGKLSVLEAIFEAGGFNLDKAKAQNVVLIRQEEDKRVSYAINLKDALEGKTYQPVYLQPKDVVYVPRTTIANVDLWVNQHLYSLIPNITFGYRLDNTNAN